MDFFLDLIIRSLQQTWLALLHNWPFLLVSVIVAALLKLYVNVEKVSAFLQRYQNAGVAAATAAAVATPFCSCGTTAVILGMMASQIPWAPVVAFMVASPLTSPQELIYSAGIFGWPFALAFFAASIALGLLGGWAAGLLENRGWLANQARFSGPTPAACACPAAGGTALAAGRTFSLEVSALHVEGIEPACGCGGPSIAQPGTNCTCSLIQPACDCSQDSAGQLDLAAISAQSAAVQPKTSKVTLTDGLQELYSSGKRLLLMFLGFAFVGYLLNGIIPVSWIEAVFGGGSPYSVPIAATLGLPLYINTETSLPLIRALMESGMSQGSALAFMIAGSGTSFGAIAGALTIARWRVVGLVVAVLWAGAILSGYLFNVIAGSGF